MAAGFPSQGLNQKDFEPIEEKEKETASSSGNSPTWQFHTATGATYSVKTLPPPLNQLEALSALVMEQIMLGYVPQEKVIYAETGSYSLVTSPSVDADDKEDAGGFTHLTGITEHTKEGDIVVVAVASQKLSHSVSFREYMAKQTDKAAALHHLITLGLGTIFGASLFLVEEDLHQDNIMIQLEETDFEAGELKDNAEAKAVYRIDFDMSAYPMTTKYGYRKARDGIEGLYAGIDRHAELPDEAGLIHYPNFELSNEDINRYPRAPFVHNKLFYFPTMPQSMNPKAHAWGDVEAGWFSALPDDDADHICHDSFLTWIRAICLTDDTIKTLAMSVDLAEAPTKQYVAFFGAMQQHYQKTLISNEKFLAWIEKQTRDGFLDLVWPMPGTGIDLESMRQRRAQCQQFYDASRAVLERVTKAAGDGKASPTPLADWYMVAAPQGAATDASPASGGSV